jgi:uncharacterized protein YbjT (DUF2867 family)
VTNMNPQVTIFGGTGFLGGCIARHLANLNIPIRVAVRHPDRRIKGIADDRIEYRQADITDEHSVSAAVRGSAGVINAVSLYVEKGDATFEAVHVEGAQRLARSAQDSGARSLIHISGLGVSLDSESRFVRARAQGEQAVLDAFPNAVIFRPSVIFGRGDAFLSTLENVTRFPVLPLFGGGNTRLQPVYVDDIAAAAHRVLTGPGTTRRIFEFGGPRIYTYRELVTLVAKHLGRRCLLLPMPFSVWRTMTRLTTWLPNPPLTFDQVVLMQRDNVASTQDAFAELGLKPHSLEERLPHCLGPDSAAN